MREYEIVIFEFFENFLIYLLINLNILFPKLFQERKQHGIEKKKNLYQSTPSFYYSENRSIQKK